MLRKSESQSISSINRGRLTNQVEHLICRGSIKLKLIIPCIDGVDAIVAVHDVKEGEARLIGFSQE